MSVTTDKVKCARCGREGSVKSIISKEGAEAIAERLEREGDVFHKHPNGWLEHIGEEDFTVPICPRTWVHNFFCPSCAGERR